jgi:predicted GH43/DUF377 family glycosyl hydrolase
LLKNEKVFYQHQTQDLMREINEINSKSPLSSLFKKNNSNDSDNSLNSRRKSKHHNTHKALPIVRPKVDSEVQTDLKFCQFSELHGGNNGVKLSFPMKNINEMLKEATHPIAQILSSLTPEERECDTNYWNHAVDYSEEMFDIIGRELVNAFRTNRNNSKFSIKAKSPKSRSNKFVNDFKNFSKLTESQKMYVMYNAHYPYIENRYGNLMSKKYSKVVLYHVLISFNKSDIYGLFLNEFLHMCNSTFETCPRIKNKQLAICYREAIKSKPSVINMSSKQVLGQIIMKLRYHFFDFYDEDLIANLHNQNSLDHTPHEVINPKFCVPLHKILEFLHAQFHPFRPFQDKVIGELYKYCKELDIDDLTEGKEEEKVELIIRDKKTDDGISIPIFPVIRKLDQFQTFFYFHLIALQLE